MVLTSKDARGTHRAASLSGKVLSDEKMNAHNTFDYPEKIKPSVLEDIRLTDKGVKAQIKPKSVNAVTVKF